MRGLPSPRGVLHLSARSEGWPFAQAETARSAWSRLRHHWPRVLACVLMGNHLHLVASGVPEDEQARLGRVVSQLREWRTSPRPSVELIPDHRVARVIRYVLLNPVRAGLCERPADWLYSTQRDLLGAVCDPWVSWDALQGWSAARWCAWLGDSVPAPVEAVDWPRLPLSRLAVASAAAHRQRVDAVRRRGPVRATFVALCWHQGWRNATVVARAAGLHPSNVRRAWGRRDVPLAARVCLASEALSRPARPSSGTGRGRRSA